MKFTIKKEIVLDFEWVNNPARYSTGQILKMNGYEFARTFYNALRSRDEVNKNNSYGCIIYMLSTSKTYYDDDVEKLKRIAVKLLSDWFHKLLNVEDCDS